MHDQNYLRFMYACVHLIFGSDHDEWRLQTGEEVVGKLHTDPSSFKREWGALKRCNDARGRELVMQVRSGRHC